MAAKLCVMLCKRFASCVKFEGALWRAGGQEGAGLVQSGSHIPTELRSKPLCVPRGSLTWYSDREGIFGALQAMSRDSLLCDMGPLRGLT